MTKCSMWLFIYDLILDNMLVKLVLDGNVMKLGMDE